MEPETTKPHTDSSQATKVIALLMLPVLIGVLVYFGKNASPAANTEKPNKQTANYIKGANVIPKTNKPTQIIKKDVPLTETDVEQEINKYRKGKGLEPLGRYIPLCDFAKVRATEVVEEFTHKGFEKRIVDVGDGTYYKNFCDNAVVQCTAAGENLAKGYFDAIKVVEAWAGSSEHENNLVGNYNVQCTAVNYDHVVSIFALTEDVSNIVPINPTNADFVKYDNEKVVFWEDVREEHDGYRTSWKGAYEVEYYDQDDLDNLLAIFDKTIEMSNYLWSGYKNESITYIQVSDAKSRFVKYQQETQDVIDEIYTKAHTKCLGYWKNKSADDGKNYSEDKKSCEEFLDAIE